MEHAAALVERNRLLGELTEAADKSLPVPHLPRMDAV